MNLPTQPYTEQLCSWPSEGQHILACYDENTILVYQAYQPLIGRYALEHGCFGGESFSYSRMSWIKPNFLWMMYRSGWGTKDGQETVLALRLRRAFFESLLAQAVNSTFDESKYPTRKAWQDAITKSCVRLQWDPDHDPSGAKQTRRAIQLGLRGEALELFGKREILEVIDMSEFVAMQRSHAAMPPFNGLQIPIERVYAPSNIAVSRTLGLSL
jgi:hypothetical protein